MIFEVSLTHKKKIFDEISILGLFEHFKVTGAILPPHAGVILSPFRSRSDMKTDLATRITDP